jgi:hypothetical protein
VGQSAQRTARKGWTVREHVYVDDGISGADWASRPGFVRLADPEAAAAV